MSMPYLQINRTSSVPLSEQIAKQLVEAIQVHRLHSGQALPTVRELATHLRVSVETVQKAYQTLKKDGWIQSRPRHGTFVSPYIGKSTTISAPSQEQKRIEWLKQMKLLANLPRMFPISGVSLPPEEVILKGMKEIAEQAVELALQVEEHDPFGLVPLRSKIQGLLTERGFWSDISAICMVNGTQQAISLIADQLVQVGDVVGVPEMCYLPLKEVFLQKGADVIPISQDGDGIDLAQLEDVCEKKGMRFLYVMPNAHYPTGQSWTDDKKKATLQLASKYRFAIIEDEYYGELYYTSIPPITLYTLGQDLADEIAVYYISSFSTILHPNLRLGYLVTPSDQTERFQHAKYLMDTTTSIVSQQLLLQLWEHIQLPSYLAQLRSRLRVARDAMLNSLQQWLPEGYMVQCPQMGLSGWVYAPTAFKGFIFFERCLQENVFVMPDEAFAVTDPVRGFQVKFGHVTPEVLDEGIKRVGRLLSGIRWG